MESTQMDVRESPLSLLSGTRTKSFLAFAECQ